MTLDCNKTRISIVVPVYHGADFLRDLVSGIETAKREVDSNYNCLEFCETIFVDDDAVDDSAEILEELLQDNSWMTLLSLSNNFGQHPATIAGILHTAGDWVVTLDEDMQHDPKHIIGMLLTTLEGSFDVCYAKSQSNVHGSFFKDVASKIFKRIVSILLKNRGIEKFNSFRIIRGSIARAAAGVAGPDTYYDMALLWFTNRLCTYEVELKDHRNAEDLSTSGYSVWGLVKHAKRLLFSSNLKFLRVGFVLGVFAALLSAILACILLLLKILSPDLVQVTGWTSTILLILFFGGLGSMLSGVLIEAVSQILAKSKGRPTFFVTDRSRDKALLKHLKEC